EGVASSPTHGHARTGGAPSRSGGFGGAGAGAASPKGSLRGSPPSRGPSPKRVQSARTASPRSPSAAAASSAATAERPAPPRRPPGGGPRGAPRLVPPPRAGQELRLLDQPCHAERRIVAEIILIALDHGQRAGAIAGDVPRRRRREGPRRRARERPLAGPLD